MPKKPGKPPLADEVTTKIEPDTVVPKDEAFITIPDDEAGPSYSKMDREVQLDVENVELEEELVDLAGKEGENDVDSSPTKSRGQKRKHAGEKINNSAARHYDRYKNQDYCKRNDGSKYCQICRKKVFGKLRSLPNEHRLRRVWILRFNLDVERSGELWVREAFSDATHCGEACPIHFPVGTHNLKNRQILPIDMRQDPESFCIQDDETFDFDNLELECVFCSAKNVLRCMVPFSRTRSRRYKWVNALVGTHTTAVREAMQEKLRNGASKFLCDWHFTDNDFEINQYGEWRLRKDAIPDPTLCEDDKQSHRIYMVNHGDNIFSRNVETKIRTDLVMMRYKFKDTSSSYRYEEKLRKTYPRNVYMYDRIEYDAGYEEEAVLDIDGGLGSSQMYMDTRLSRSHEADDMLAYQSDISMPTGSQDYDGKDESDDSDEESDSIRRVEQCTGESLNIARFCQVCNRIISSEKSMAEHKPRTWPFDDAKHEKWLEIMNWPKDFEQSMRLLWIKRRNDFVSNGLYHYCPINVCETHLQYRQLQDKVVDWLKTYCILCDEDLKDPNLLLPFPQDQQSRRIWLQNLVCGQALNKLVERRWKWLKDRLTRPKATRYRLCVYHFNQDCFVEKDDCVEFNEASMPLSLALSEYDITPKGPQGMIKCPLCDMWGTGDDLVEIRSPSTQAEKILLVEMLVGDKPLMKRGVEQLAAHQCKICRAHLPPVDPYLIIAERRLVAHIQVQCIQCNRRDVGGNMVPFPCEDPDKKRYWLDAICRDHYTRVRLAKRLDMEGRHYLCTSHFHKNSLRYINGFGVWKRFIYMPLAVTPSDRERIMDMQGEEEPYTPLLINGLDDNGVVYDVTYDEVSALLGEVIEFPGYYKERDMMNDDLLDKDQEEQIVIEEEVVMDPTVMAEEIFVNDDQVS